MTQRNQTSGDHAAAGPPLPAANAPFGAAPTNTPDVNIEGFEVTQAIQHVDQVGVPLLADKVTVVRAYVGTNDSTPWLLDGAIEIRAVAPDGTAGPWALVNSLAPVTVNPAENGQLRLKREDAGRSMNFRVPDDTLLGAGKYDVRLLYVYPAGQFERRRYLVDRPECNRSYTLVDSPPLRINVIGLRYQAGNPAVTYAPTARDFALLRSWLGRAYPVPDVYWTQVTMDYPGIWNFRADEANAFVSAVRTADVSNGTDHRTHYYGMAHDGGGFMRGLAVTVPGTPDPSVVASGPTGTNTWGWDVDGSYGDWYGGHEIGHTFGRPHAPFCGALGGAPYPYPAGQLSPNNGEWVGFDVGDAANGIPMQALSGVIYHDVMTYCPYEWLSEFTYNAIRARLVAEDALSAGPAPPAAGPGPAPPGAGVMGVPPSVHVVALINLTQGTGRILQVHPGIAPPSDLSGPFPGRTFTLRATKADGTVLATYTVPFRLNACLAPGDDDTGSVDAVIPNHPDLGRLILLDGATELDRFDPGAEPAKPANVRPAGTAVAPSAAAVPDSEPVIVWDDPARAALAPSAGPPPRYTVQISTDGGRTWRTVGLGLPAPRVRLDRQMLSGAAEVQVRVTATNGFRSESTVQKVATAALLGGP